MKYLLTTAILIITFSLTTKSQIRYSGKIEIGYLKFLNTTIRVDPGPEWKGYYLNEGQNGLELNLINGMTFLNKKVFTGVGVGYLNFEGINGVEVFADFEYLPFRTRLTPLLNLKLGYNHIWNQYDGGRGTILSEIGTGLNYKLTNTIDIFLETSFLMTQQSALIPIRLGLRF
jgi:hypothetical protein